MCSWGSCWQQHLLGQHMFRIRLHISLRLSSLEYEISASFITHHLERLPSDIQWAFHLCSERDVLGGLLYSRGIRWIVLSLVGHTQRAVLVFVLSFTLVTTLGLDDILPCVDFMDVIMGDIPAPDAMIMSRQFWYAINILNAWRHENVVAGVLFSELWAGFNQYDLCNCHGTVDNKGGLGMSEETKGHRKGRRQLTRLEESEQGSQEIVFGRVTNRLLPMWALSSYL